MLHATLLYPPITDATSPYHSLVYLASSARSAGFTDIEIRDTNIEALNFCAQPDVAAGMTADWRARRRTLGSRGSLSALEQLEYLQLVRAEAVDPFGVTSAIATMRDPERFYDYSQYKSAAEALGLWLESLSCSGWPGQFEPGGQSLRRSGWLNLSSVADLTNQRLLERLARPFLPYFEAELFPALLQRTPRVIGINITYTSQLPYALWLVRRIRRLRPDAFIVCGGTEVSGVWKYLRDTRHMVELFDGADACVVGEGETAFVRVLEEVIDGRQPGPIDNVVRFDRAHRTLAPPPAIHYENLDALPTPDYGLMDPGAYFSPYPLVNYSPTRGCYWNKCTFCDYGLNFGTPTSPWRQVSLERSVEHLRAASAYSRHIYLSVDVLAPGRLLQLTEAIADANIDIRWAAEIRLERYFNEERCRTLRRSGCVALSVGFEAGSQRILDLIDKGTTLSDIKDTIRNFSSATIAVQMMGFTGFPSETHDEAMASVRYLERTRQWWTTSALGSFLLTPGAIIARKLTASQPDSLRALEGDDIVRTLHLRETEGESPAAAEETSTLREAKRRLVTADFDRPYAGGIDAAHSIFYYDRYGRRFPADVRADAAAIDRRPDASDLLVPSAVTLSDERYDAVRAVASLEVAEMGRRAAGAGRALDHQGFVAALEATEPLRRSDTPLQFVARADGAVLPCPVSLIRLLQGLKGGRRASELAQLVTALDPADLQEVTAYAVGLRRIARAPSSGSGGPGAPGDGHDVIEALVLAGILRNATRDAATLPDGTVDREVHRAQDR